ncbi:Cytosolic protein [Blumeria graminis f. sp. tritici 96224]|uniref:Bgt-4849 n=1 Tax=Blumeria graminis f. sp. tritici 96224 TaxID=1268274 RepID=A0A381LKQ5_BLUGR|nr:Cytosolic protein [Blumeria graminis f. sp. tritici 96224]
MSTRSISVDNVLQNASEIPSGQARIPPPRKHSLPKRPNGALVTRLAPQKVPGRSTKLTEKLVLIPDTEEGVDEEDENEARRFTSKYEEEETEPLKDDEWDLLKKRGKSWPGSQHIVRPRVTKQKPQQAL